MMKSLCTMSSVMLCFFLFSYVFIPILPASLLDFLTAPTPFLMGVHTSYQNELPEMVECLIFYYYYFYGEFQLFLRLLSSLILFWKKLKCIYLQILTVHSYEEFLSIFFKYFLFQFLSKPLHLYFSLTLSMSILMRDMLLFLIQFIYLQFQNRIIHKFLTHWKW